MSSSDGSSPNRLPRVGAVVVAAGSGRRMGGVRKQYLEIEGEPVLLHALRPFMEHPRVERVVVVLPAADVADPPAWLAALPVTLAAGGAERADSVRSGLDRLDGGIDIVLVHDGARPLVTEAVITRVIERAADAGAIAAVPAVDTIKVVDAEGRVHATPDRSTLWHAQTPQGFPLELLRQAHARAAREGWPATDDAVLFERSGHPVYVVEGDPRNIKVTAPDDLVTAAGLVRRLRHESS